MSSGREMPSGKDNLAVAASRLYLERAGIRKRVSMGIKKEYPPRRRPRRGKLERRGGPGGPEQDSREIRRQGPAPDGRVSRGRCSLLHRICLLVRRGGGGESEGALRFPLFHYVILFPRKSLPTREVYRRWERPDPPPAKVDPVSLAERFRRGDFPLENGLEDAVSGMLPEILSLKKVFRSLGARFVLVSGSGSSVFSVFRQRREAEEVYEYLGTLFRI